MEPVRREEPHSLQEVELALELQGKVQLTAMDDEHDEQLRKKIRRICRSRSWKVMTLREGQLVFAQRRDFEFQTDVEMLELADVLKR